MRSLSFVVVITGQAIPNDGGSPLRAGNGIDVVETKEKRLSVRKMVWHQYTKAMPGFLDANH